MPKEPKFAACIRAFTSNSIAVGTTLVVVKLQVTRTNGEVWFGTKNLQISRKLLSSFAKLELSPDVSVPRLVVWLIGARVSVPPALTTVTTPLPVVDWPSGLVIVR